jgi:hypothetical protein
MTSYVQRTPFRLIADFQDVSQAETVRDAVNEALYNAAREVDKLYKNQNGVADISDITGIYNRYGFRNDSGWQQLRPLKSDQQTVIWDVPEGMLVHEAEQLLTVLGAVSLSIESDEDDDLLRQAPHPAALFLSELDDIVDIDEDDFFAVYAEEKKILH